MSRKFSPPETEIDFGDGISNELDTRLSYILYILSSLSNPYVGNKRKMMHFIIKSLNKHNIGYKTVIDLFSGSSYVSITFKMLGSKVHSNDLLMSAYINAVAYVVNNDTFLSDDEKKFLCETKSIDKPYLFFDKYCNKFTENEKLFITNFSYNIHSLFYNDPIKTAIASVVLQNHIISNCFVGGRLNSGQVLAKLDHRINHSRNKGSGIPMHVSGIDWIYPVFAEDKNVHSATNLDAMHFLKTNNTECELIYIDPPYGGDQSDYAHMFMFFEELLYQNNDIYVNFEENNALIDRKSYLNAFSNKFINSKNYSDNFDELISLVKKYPNIAISYNDSSWGSIDEICDVIKRHRKEVIVEEFSYDYKYRADKKQAKEYLIISKE